MEGFRVREAVPSDARLLTDMMVEAVNWNWLQSRPRMAVLADRDFLHYVSGWQKPGDGGCVAEGDEDSPVGACWYRLFAANDPGHGFLGPGVPELILGVSPLWRAQGVGRALLDAVVTQARTAGHARISLSVERDNYAINLYRSAGFFRIASTGTRDTMVRTLR